MSEIARWEERRLAPASEPAPTYTDPTGGRLVAWAESLGAAHRIGSALCETAFVPVHFRKKPEEAAAAILYGDEVGLTPTQALQNIYVISGKPALYARTMVALTLAAGHEVWTVKKTDGEVTVSGRRRGSQHTVTETWTTARANKAGYTKNAKYQTDPQAMLYARAASDVCRQVAPDALAGLAYSVEEMELVDDEPAQPVRLTARRSSARPKSQQSAPAPAPEPSYDEPPLDEGSGPVEQQAPPVADAPGPEPDDNRDQITRSQLSKIAAQLRDIGMDKDRAAALELVSEIVGREIQTRNDLTRGEASALIEEMGRRLGELPEDAEIVEDQP